MFGFIRPVKAELRVKEADRFQQVYCGLCHAIRAEYGRFYTLFLSYDMTFFALVAGSEEAETAPPCRKRCDASPFRRKSCAETDDALRLAADASILLTYHKFQDDLADEKGATTKPGVFAGGDAVMGARTVVEAVAIAKKVAESMDAYMKALPADNTPDPYADIPVFSTPTSDVLAKQGI